MAFEHTDKLKDCLIANGIYNEEKDCIIPGKEKNIIWLDEMGQFFNYLLLRGQRRKATGLL